jgi:D-alanyl-lipoteichoic acid acyltransferase DltB (MBOAT superfamily)
MIFNSVDFLLFFAAFFFLYWGISNKGSINVKNAFTILASYLFYGWWDWRFLGLIALSSAADYSIGIALQRNTRERNRKLLLYGSIAINLGILATFKYFNFFVESLQELAQSFSMQFSLTTLNIVLPVGISFYTFQTLSYTIDVYKGKLSPTRNILSFFAFVSFFPQLVAGPIERASSLLPQFEVKKKLDYHQCMAGLRLTVWGFFKKLVIADNVGVLVDTIFSADQTPTGANYLIGAILFAIQIYADFSGYSDIAIGISKTLGFNLMSNFKTPYFAKSLNTFWQRWHISLSTWFRDYLYIPLGGNRKSSSRVQFNLFITFLLSGLWHGANVTFLIWGALHGIALIAEKRIQIKANKWIAWFCTFTVVVLLWLPFRAESASHLVQIVRSIISFSNYSTAEFQLIVQQFSTTRFIALVVILIAFLAVEKNMELQNFHDWIMRKNKFTRYASYYILILSILFLGNFTVKPSFIYFQF